MKIVLDKERTLKFNYNSVVWMEEAAFKTDRPGNALRAILWACLKHEDPNLTLEQAGELITAANIAEIREKCFGLASSFFPKGDESRPLSADSPDSSSGVSADSISASVN